MNAGRNSFNVLALLLVVLLATVTASAGAQGTYPQQRPGYPPVVCPSGTSPCNGPFGSRCYAPARGQQCTQGLVCSIGSQACVGPYGVSCYAAGQGQSCMQGLVCAIGQQLCAAGGYARCYSPARGETCG